MRRVCIFCGANPGARPEFSEAAKHLGALLAAKKIAVVYGGGHTGLMGVIADAALAGGGEVIGVIPRALEQKELAHRGVTQLHVVATMHERKARMADLSDAFIALPGGIGTMEEFFEVWTWAQLGLHRKACGLLNVAGFFDPLRLFLDHLVAQRFLLDSHRGMVLVEPTPEPLLARMAGYQPPQVEKWIDRQTL